MKRIIAAMLGTAVLMGCSLLAIASEKENPKDRIILDAVETYKAQIAKHYGAKAIENIRVTTRHQDEARIDIDAVYVTAAGKKPRTESHYFHISRVPKKINKERPWAQFLYVN